MGNKPILNIKIFLTGYWSARLRLGKGHEPADTIVCLCNDSVLLALQLFL